jgi:hypothetical protein
MIFVSFCSNMTGITSGAGTANLSGNLDSPPYFCGVRVAESFVFCVMFCRLLFVFLYFFFWPLYCLSFFDLRLLDYPFGILNLCYCV